MSEPKCKLRVHLTNVTAIGPVQVVKSLLPALEADETAAVEDIYLPDSGELAAYTRISPGPPPLAYRRFLPRAVSRMLECTLLARRFDGDTPIVVFGDIPLHCDSPQVVFLQTAQLCEPPASPIWRRQWTHGLARLLLRLNARRVAAFVVQTDLMKDMLERTLPVARGKVMVIAQPAPSWLIESGLRRNGRRFPDADKLDLLYPADSYPHKNHALLGRIRPEESTAWPVARLTLTIDARAHPNPGIGWLDCAGLLAPANLLRRYGEADALVYLSTTESYGLPLVEAMHIGLPIVAPDLPYVRTLCGDQAIYFDVTSIESLRLALVELQRRLAMRWWPDWARRSPPLPDDWASVASAFVNVIRTTCTRSVSG
jgi:hypothetical protein